MKFVTTVFQLDNLSSTASLVNGNRLTIPSYSLRMEIPSK